MTTHLIKLNRSLLEQFRLFLDQKESKLADQLMLSAPLIPGSIEKIPLQGSGHLRLSQALQMLGERLRGYKEQEVSEEEWRSGIALVNQALWEYAELLQDAVQELVFQLQQADFNSWNHNFFVVVSAFKELLFQRIEDLIWTYRRLEELLLAYRARARRLKNLWGFFGKFFRWFSGPLDRSILNHLFRSEELLSMHYKQFTASYESFNAMAAKEKEEERKFQNFWGLKELPSEQRDLFIELHRLVKISEENSKTLVLKPQNLIAATKNLAKSGKVSLLFRSYIRELRKKLFEMSRKWQNESDSALEEVVGGLKSELLILGKVIGSYREMWLSSAANPYLKTRWSFTEWIIGPEPRKTKDLKLQIYEIETLASWYQHLLEAIKKGEIENSDIKRRLLFEEIDQILHEMGQPLSSRSSLQGRAERLISLIEKADELGSSLGNVQEPLTRIFLRALRSDAKYQVLHDFLQFENLYSIHRGLMPPLHDPAHEKRVKLFYCVIHHVQYWLKEHLMVENGENLETEEAAIQEELQKLLASLQKDQIPIHERTTHLQMLLEYRYIFSCFFHSLRPHNVEGREVRSQFSFVDQYLDAIEIRLAT